VTLYSEQSDNITVTLDRVGNQSWTKMFFFQCIGSHVLLKLLLGLTGTG
jgi:hypothetical protein